MNGPQDVGGMTSFGPVIPEHNEPWFHADWERRALAITLAMGATRSWNIDTSRHARETLPPLTYWSASYYEIWILGLMKLMTAAGLVTPSEMDSGHMEAPTQPVKRVLTAGIVPAVLAAGGPANRASDRAATFSIGDRVRTRGIHPTGHTRLPRYARGKTGEIVHMHGTHVFPDSSAHGLGDDPQWLYAVKFTARELWGHDSPDSVHIDLWEPYLEAAS